MAIQLTIVVDTATLPAATNSSFDNPQTFGHDQAFMITDTTHCVPGTNGTATLQLQGPNGFSIVGETLQIWGTSLSNQLLDEVFIYDFTHWKDDNVLDINGMKPQTFIESAEVPDPTKPFPPHHPPTFMSEQRTFPCTEIDVKKPGTESFYVRFMVYGPMEVGGRQLKGYYQWDPSISTV